MAQRLLRMLYVYDLYMCSAQSVVGEGQLLLSSECGALHHGGAGGGAGINSNLVQRHSL